MKTVIFYHANCLDGFGAAWAAYLHFKDKVEYKPIHHSERVEDFLKPTKYIFLDYSPPRDIVEYLLARDHEITIIDHHKTTYENLFGLTHPQLEVIIKMANSGAVLSWNYFHKDKEAPKLLRWIEDRDLWVWDIPESEAGTEALAAEDHDFDVWCYYHNFPEVLLDRGNALLKLKRKKINEGKSRAYITKVSGYTVPVVNSCSLYVSALLSELCEERPQYPFAAAWVRMNDGRLKWSLRSVGDFDVAFVAEHYGGGGHKNAAGFYTDLDGAR